MTTTEKAMTFFSIILIKTLISINFGGGGFSPWKTSFLSLLIVVNEEIIKKYSNKKDHT